MDVEDEDNWLHKDRKIHIKVSEFLNMNSSLEIMIVQF